MKQISFTELVKLHENASVGAVGAGAIASTAMPLGQKKRKKKKSPVQRRKKSNFEEDVVSFKRQWAPSNIQLDKILRLTQALIKKGLGDELNGRFDNFLYAIEQYNKMNPQSELADLSERHLHQIYEYGKSTNWKALSRGGFKARQRGIARSWGQETTA